jgi:hypothetical protein
LDVGGGNDLALAIEVAADAREDVAAFVAAERLPISAVVGLAPADGPFDQAVADPSNAVGIARALRDAARRVVREREATRLHLFLSGPGGLALLLGHRWNGFPSTIIYEHLGAASYCPTLTVV